MNIAARILNFSLMIAMPFGLAVYLSRKLKTEWRLFGIGAITFILSQVFHLPFNVWLLRPLIEDLGLSITQGGLQLAAVGLFYGLSAGLFEEITRYLGYRFWIKDERDWKSALMYGAGHGGIEAILLGGLVLFGFIQAITLRGVELSTVVDPDQVEVVRAQLEAYWAAPWHLAILGAVERLAAIVFHLSATVMVLQAVKRKSFLWVLLAVGWHTLLDAVAVYASQTWNPYITEVIILAFGLISLGLILYMRPSSHPGHDDIHTAYPDSSELGLPEIQPIVASKEDLEDSRYD
jgi:uncharacterized membrane protein YhfC